MTPRTLLAGCLLLAQPLFAQPHSNTSADTLVFDKGAGFENDFAHVIKNGRDHWLHYTGLLVDELHYTTSQYYVIKKNEHYGVISHDGRQLLPAVYDEVEIKDYQGFFFKIRKGDKYGIADSTGKVLQAPQYDEVDNLSPLLAKVGAEGRYGLFNLQTGRLVLPVTYKDADIIFGADDMAAVEKDGLHGVCNDKGEWIITPAYQQVRWLYHHLFAVQQNGRWHFWQQQLLPEAYDDMDNASDGWIMVKRGGRCGYADTTGALKIPVQYDDAGAFDLGLAIITLKGKKGMINTQGKIILAPAYDDVSLNKYQLYDALAPLRRHCDCMPQASPEDINRWCRIEFTRLGRKGCARMDGTILLQPEYNELSISSDGIITESNGKAALFDTAGKQLIPALYDRINVSNERPLYFAQDRPCPTLYVVNKGEKTGLFDQQGRQVLPVKFAHYLFPAPGIIEAEPSSNYDTSFYYTTTGRLIATSTLLQQYQLADTDRFIVSTYRDGQLQKLSLTDDKNHTLFTQTHNGYEDSYDRDEPRYHSGLLKFTLPTTGALPNTYLDRNGHIKTFAAYERTDHFFDGLAKAWHNDKTGYIDTSGHEVIPVIYDGITRMRDEQVFEVEKDNLHGIISYTGKTIVPVAYDRISKWTDSSNTWLVTKDDKMGLIDSTGKELLPPVYNSIESITSSRFAMIAQNQKWGLVNASGQLVIPVIYTTIQQNYSDTSHWPVMVQRGSSWYYLRENGTVLAVKVREVSY